MMASMAQIQQAYLMAMSLIFGVLCGVALVAPQTLLGSVELVITTPSAFAELRAAYFGCFVGLAALFLAGARRAECRQLAVGVAALVLCGFVVGRFLSLVVDGPPNAFSTAMHALEGAGGLIGAMLWWRGRSAGLPDA